MKNIQLTDESLKNIEVVLDYLLASELKSYEEYCIDLINDAHYDFILQKDFYNRPEIEHIYATARRMKDAICI
jgi:hypothetical protein